MALVLSIDPRQALSISSIRFSSKLVKLSFDSVLRLKTNSDWACQKSSSIRLVLIRFKIRSITKKYIKAKGQSGITKRRTKKKGSLQLAYHPAQWDRCNSWGRLVHSGIMVQNTNSPVIHGWPEVKNLFFPFFLHFFL